MATSYVSREMDKFTGLSSRINSGYSFCSSGFSPGDARLFARAEPSGTLRIWDTETGRLKHEYSPSSHLSATCCVVAWAPNKSLSSNESSGKKKKWKSGVTQTVESLQLVAMGTTSGSMMLYSAAKAELSTQMHDMRGGDGHGDRVTGICWSDDGETLYSCSLDCHIIEWNVRTATVAHKWKGDKSSLYSIHLCHTQRHLVTASRTIKLWDLHSKQVLKTFVGHATEVFSLHVVPGHSRSENKTKNNDIVGSYVISSALNDRKISLWHISGDLDSTRVCNDVTASFSLNEDPLEVLVRSINDNQPFQLAVRTQSGRMSLFEHILNGHMKKPVKPCGVVEFVTTGTERAGDSPRPLSIVASGMTSGAITSDQQIIVAYEDFIRPVFERLSIKDLQRLSSCLIRKDPSLQSTLQTNESASKVKTPQISKDLTVLAPGYMASAGLTRHEESESSRKRKRRKSFEMSLEERLEAIDSTAPSVSSSSSAAPDVRHPPRADSLATLLEQGLQSGDKKILNNVLQRTDATFIRNTVSRLSPGVVVTLIKELTRRMQGHAQSQRTVLLWVNSVLTQHKAFLVSIPDVDELIQPLRHILYSPTELLERLMQVNTQLKSFLNQGNKAEFLTSDTSDSLSSKPALVTYQNESSDEEDFREMNRISASDSEEEWNEENENDVNNDDDDDDDDDSSDDDDAT